jgi:hypothetical protein
VPRALGVVGRPRAVGRLRVAGFRKTVGRLRAVDFPKAVDFPRAMDVPKVKPKLACEDLEHRPRRTPKYSKFINISSYLFHDFCPYESLDGRLTSVSGGL